MNCTQDTHRLLSAFHAATMLKRAPTAATPDGHRKFFSLDLLVLEGRIEAGSDLCALAREAARMTRRGLLTHRRLFARDFWTITPAGAHVLRTELRDRGLTELAAIALAVEQAEYDARQAAGTARAARIMFEAASAAAGARLPSEDALLYAMLNGSVTK
jgi:hypothetical protein